MPELPEVETIVRDLRQKLVGLTIEDIKVYDSRVLNKITPEKLAQRLKGRVIRDVTRRSKAAILSLDRGYAVIQLKMTGQLIYGEDLKTVRNLKETKLTLRLSSRKFLNYNDQRMFGKWSCVDDPMEMRYIKSAGPEPLNGTFTYPWLEENLKNRSTPIKVLLMNQEFLAGIGNIYASEILFAAGINPRKRPSRLNQNQILALHKSTVSILKEAVRSRGTSMRNYRDASGEKGEFMSRIRVYAKEGEPCPACSTAIKKIVQAQRSSFYCPRCQR